MFGECFGAYEHDILKKQQMPSEDVSNPAFLFELKKRAFIRKTGPAPPAPPVRSKYRVGVLDLQLKDVIYGTLKSLAAEAK